MNYTKPLFKKQKIMYKTNFLLEAVTALTLVGIFVFSYPSTSKAHHRSDHQSRSLHPFNVEDAIHNKKIVMMAIGTAVYYQNNCMGLTSRGTQYLTKAIRLHNINWNTISEDYDYKAGHRISEGYSSCNKLRSAISDAGLGAMIR